MYILEELFFKVLKYKPVYDRESNIYFAKCENKYILPSSKIIRNLAYELPLHHIVIIWWYLAFCCTMTNTFLVLCKCVSFVKNKKCIDYLFQPKVVIKQYPEIIIYSPGMVFKLKNCFFNCAMMNKQHGHVPHNRSNDLTFHINFVFVKVATHSYLKNSGSNSNIHNSSSYFVLRKWRRKLDFPPNIFKKICTADYEYVYQRIELIVFRTQVSLPWQCY